MLKNKLAIVILLLAVLYYYYHHSRTVVEWGPTVKTNEGSIKGIVSKSRDGRPFYSWHKIPYAQPPIGPLRFSSPKPVQKWEGVKDGSEYGPGCVQVQFLLDIIMGEEDCLFLNVHAPKLDKNPSLLPVLVYIHGGAFISGSADMWNPSYFMDEDIIIVTINYRLGILGFMSTGDHVIRGNMGLKDQALALKWVNQNIEKFGGDPKKVQIIGQSAGAASVHYLTLSESTRGLFRKAISMYGTSILPWAFTPTQVAVEKTKKIASDLKCETGNHEKMADCLKSLDVSELLGAYKEEARKLSLVNPTMDGILFQPTVETVEDEEAFLTQSPFDVVAEGKAHKIPWMSGVSKDEGLIAANEFYRFPQAMEKFDKNWDQGLQNSFYFSPTFSTEEASAIGRKLKEFYFPNNLQNNNGGTGTADAELEREEKILNYTDMFSDGLFLVGQSEVAAVQKKFSPVYLYFFNKVDKGVTFITVLANLGDTFHRIIELALAVGRILWDQYILRLPPKVYGNEHGADGMYFAPYFLIFIDKDDSRYAFSKDCVRMFVDFATNDEDNGTPLKFRGIPFTPNTAKDKDGPLMYMAVNEEPRMIPEPFAHRTALWHSIKYTKLFSSKVS